MQFVYTPPKTCLKSENFSQTIDFICTGLNMNYSFSLFYSFPWMHNINLDISFDLSFLPFPHLVVKPIAYSSAISFQHVSSFPFASLPPEILPLYCSPRPWQSFPICSAHIHSSGKCMMHAHYVLSGATAVNGSKTCPLKSLSLYRV